MKPGRILRQDAEREYGELVTMKSWMPIATDQVGANGAALFYDDCAAGGFRRFYGSVMS